MKIFPATDIIGGKAVRLVRGDYEKITYYGDPLEIAKSFEACGAEFLHAVDLEGAKAGGTPNFDTIEKIIRETGLKVQVGGGIRNAETVKKYVAAGAFRVILGTAAVTQAGFAEEMVRKYDEKIAVGVDIKDGKVAIKGWTETCGYDAFDFCAVLEKAGVRTVICTDISKDGMMAGTNRELYARLNREFGMDIIASGGVSSIEDIKYLAQMNIYGAILGKALYEGGVSLKEAIAAARGGEA